MRTAKSGEITNLFLLLLTHTHARTNTHTHTHIDIDIFGECIKSKMAATFKETRSGFKKMSSYLFSQIIINTYNFNESVDK